MSGALGRGSGGSIARACGLSVSRIIRRVGRVCGSRIGDGGVEGAAGAYLRFGRGGVLSSSAKAVSAVVGIMSPQASTAAMAPRRSRCWCVFLMSVIS